MSGMADGIHVLHVDDEPGFAELTATYLERGDERFDVRTATTPETGLEMFAEHDVDCIVSDHDMPNMTGIEFLETVREEQPDLPFILFTGKGSEEIASEAISAGVTDYLQKKSGSSQYSLLANRIRKAVSSRRAQSNYREIFEKATDGIVIHDSNAGEILDVNQKRCEMLGYSREELIGSTLEKFSANEDGYTEAEARQRIQAAREGESQIFEWVDETKAGERMPVEVHLKHTRIGGEDRVLALVRDISERQERERELEQANSMLSTLYETLPVGVAVLDRDGRIERANERAEAVFGLTESDIADRTYDDPDWEIFGEDGESIPAEELPFARVLETGEPVYKFEHGIKLPEGDERWLSINAAPIRNQHDEIERIVTTIADVTDSHKQERAIASYLDRLERIQRKTRRLMQTASKTETARVAVETAQDVLGATLSGVHLISDDEQILEPIAFIDAGRDGFGEPPTYERGADSDTPSGVVWEAFNARETHLIDDTREFGKLAEMTPARSAIIHPLEDHGVFIVSSTEPHGFDDTDQTLVDLVAVSLTSALDRVEREETLRKQRDKLEEFAGVVSHDLQNPLNVAEGRLDLARAECDSEHLDAIGPALDRIDRIAEDILWLAREGRDIGSVDAVSLHETIDAAWHIVADQTEQAELYYGSDDLSTVTIEADETRLSQLFENGLRNAIDHGGADVTVNVGLMDDGFYVEDDGPGIPEDRRDNVFTAGYSTGDEGTGFGLNIVKQVAEAHDWDIQVTEGAEGGARFEITGVEFDVA